MDTLVKKHFLADLDPEIQRLISLASFDLYFGPLGPVDDDGREWPGFEKSCKLIANAVHVSDVWVSDWDEIRDSEPDWSASDDDWEPNEEDGETEDDRPIINYGEDWTHYKARQAKRIVFGELADYV